MKRVLFVIASLTVLLSSCQKKDYYVIESDSSLFAVYPIAQVVSRDGGECKIKITGSESWTVSFEEGSKADWITPSSTSGQGAGEVSFTFGPATSPANMRNVVLNITAGDKILQAKIAQETLRLEDNEVLIDGIIWTTSNLGMPGEFTSSPDEVGMLYQFNRNIPYPYDGGVPANWPTTPYVNDKTDWLPENDPCPEGYRICTTLEMVLLWEKGATWVSAGQMGFKRDGIVIGVPQSVAAGANKDNLNSLGALFLPQSGWRRGDGVLDRNWLVSVRSATQLDDTKGGMSLGDSGGYRDTWGWGDGPKEYASCVRCVRNIVVE